MDTFKILVVAVVAVALLLLVMGYFGGNDESLVKEIRKGLDYAETNFGKTHSIEATIQKDTAFNASTFDTGSRSVRFLCSSAGTCSGEELSISSRIMKAKKTELYNLHFRCEDEDILTSCVIYFGENPAQIEVSELQISADKKSVSFTTENTGNLDAVQAEYALKIYSQAKEGEKLVEEKTGEIQNLSAGESQKTIINIDTETAGEYRALVTVKGENAGSGEMEETFSLSERTTNCTTTKIGTTTLLNGKCRTKLLCEDCEFGSDCAEKWTEQGKTGFTEVYSDGVYIEEEPINGEC